jgi:hypothetical protein
MLFFVHLLAPNSKKPSPQRPTAEENQTPVANQVHQQTVDHLHHVKADHFLERRWFL